MTSITITFREDGVPVPIINKADGLEFLLHQFDETQRHAEMFHEGMMKAQEHSGLLRRFIEKRELSDEFALFVVENRKHARRPDVLNEFGFIRREPDKRQPPQAGG